ncbi:MAG: polyketide cyclase [Herminiimonas sp.]|nr:polyketide cyclase [Herminiimonas sp.]
MREQSAGTRQWTTWLGGIALGAAAMYLADPVHGRRRRARAQDKMRKMGNKAGDAINAAMRDAGNRLTGLQARAGSLLGQSDEPIDDQVLEARVHARLGRALSHSRSIDVTVRQGCVTLSGRIPAQEKPQLLKLVQAIPGVAGVTDKLDTREQSGSMRDLPGTEVRSQGRDGVMHANWTPALRLMTSLGGGMLGLYGMARRSTTGTLLAAAGLGLLARGVTNMNLKQMLGLGGNAQPVNVQKTIGISAPPAAVFDMWSRYENFPHFMSHVMEVIDLGQQRSHWIVKGPAGANVEWDSMLTESTRPTRLAWRSEPGAAVDNAGSVHLEPMDGGTRVTVRMSYRPPAGAVGQVVAMLLGSDPEQAMDDDLMRMKNFIETGIPPHDAAQPVSAAGQVLH